MKVSTALNLVKASTLQNISNDYANDDIRIQYVNGAVSYIFFRLMSKWSRYWATHEETLTWSNSVFTTTYGIWRVWEAKDAQWGEIVLAPISADMNASRAGDDEPAKWMRRSNSSSKQLVVKDTTISTMSIIYSRMPKKHDVANIGTEELDLPDELSIAFVLAVNWLIQPIHLEQWATLANNYYNQLNTLLDEYCYSTVTNVSWFTS